MSSLKKFTEFELSIEEQDKSEKAADHSSAKKKLLLKTSIDKIEELLDKGEDLVSIKIGNSELPVLVKVLGFDVK